MAMNWSRRGIMGAALAAAVPAGLMAADDKSTPAAKGKLTDQSLGTLLKAMGLETTVEDTEELVVFEIQASGIAGDLFVGRGIAETKIARSLVQRLEMSDDEPAVTRSQGADGDPVAGLALGTGNRRASGRRV